MHTFNTTLGRLASFAPLILRVVIGVLFLYHGIDKFNGGISNVEGFFDSQGVPLPGLTAPLTAILEIVLGIALIVGAYTRLAAAGLAAIMVGALIFVKLEADVLGGSELDFSYLAGLVAIMLLGPGRLSVDEAMKIDDTVIDLRGARTAANIA